VTAPAARPPVVPERSPTGRRAIGDDLGVRRMVVVGAVVVAAAVALAFYVLRLADRNGGPAIVIEDPRADATIVVEVAGEVATPGVYGFPYGARVNDALVRAGGAGPEADLSGLNLAQRLGDGDRLVVPRLLPTAPAPVHEWTAVPPGQPPTATIAAPMPAAAVAGGSPININTATAEELETLPEIGETRAEAIVAYREANGPFASVDELVNVDGISERIVEVLRPHVTVGP
jgi:competence protein ComEA